MNERNDVINEVFLYMYEKKYPHGARITVVKIVIILSPPSSNIIIIISYSRML